MTTIYLTDGRNWHGPYDKETETVDIHRGERYLREVQHAGQLWAVEAGSEEEAKRKFSKEGGT